MIIKYIYIIYYILYIHYNIKLINYLLKKGNSIIFHYKYINKKL